MSSTGFNVNDSVIVFNDGRDLDTGKSAIDLATKTGKSCTVVYGNFVSKLLLDGNARTIQCPIIALCNKRPGSYQVRVVL